MAFHTVDNQNQPVDPRAIGWIIAVALILATPVFGPGWLSSIPDWLTLPISEIVGGGLTWFAREATIGGVAVQEITRFFASLLNAPIEGSIIVLAEGIYGGRGLNKTQVIPPFSWLAIGGAATILAYRLGGLKLAATTALGTLFLVTFGLWHNAMITLSSVMVSVLLAALLGLALGIWSFRSEQVENVTRAVMNVMQTVPIFSYLLPTLLLFGYGPSAALIATVVYALPPMVHNTVLALKSVPSETLECGNMAGCTKRQLLWQVQLPTALPKLAVGLNQSIMMTLNMVIIASMIGAGGLGFDVLVALRKLDIGGGIEAGAGIVVLAVILDRLSQAAAHRAAHGKHREPGQWPISRLLIVWVVVATGLALMLEPLQVWPKDMVISTASYWNDLVSWINQVFYDVLNDFRTFALLQVMRPVRDLLAAAPWSMLVACVASLGYLLGGLRLAALVGSLALFIAVTGYWGPAMNSVYLILISVSLAVLFGFPIGFWLSGKTKIQGTANLILDTLQTLPTLVYLLPAVMLFRIGDVSAVIAVVLYAMAPAIRYAMIGMSQVPPARLEAARISGCTNWQTLIWIRLPAAFPTLLIGINQTIMMAFSMLIIAALVGTKDLGQQVLIALNQSLVGQGIVAGLCVACLALIADALLKAGAARASTGRRKDTQSHG